MKLYWIIFAFLGLALSSCARQSNDEFILGKWVVYKTTNLREDSLNSLGKPFLIRSDTLEFTKGNILKNYWFPGDPPDVYKFSFENDSILLLGNRYYIFRRIDDNKMSLDDYDPELPQIKPLFLRNYWRRLEE